MKNTFVNPETNRCAIILAGGDGTRLKTLTRQISGDDRPKQFCPLFDGETLLEKTRKRAEMKIQADSVYYGLTRAHEKFYDKILSEREKIRSFVQPENKGTAPAILFSLLKLEKINPEATVVIFPSDHYFSDDAAFMKQVERAFRAAENNPKMLVVLGIEPEKAETSYGWIEPVESLFEKVSNAISKVQSFIEKPSASTAQKLFVKGCLWNSFVMVGKVRTFLAAIEKHTPELFRIFKAGEKFFETADEKSILRSIYTWIPEVNFSSEILQKCIDELYVLRVGDVAWSDLGEPQRVIGTLSKIGIKTDWMKATAA